MQGQTDCEEVTFGCNNGEKLRVLDQKEDRTIKVGAVAKAFLLSHHFLAKKRRQWQIVRTVDQR